MGGRVVIVYGQATESLFWIVYQDPRIDHTNSSKRSMTYPFLRSWFQSCVALRIKKTIRGACPVILYKLCDKDAVGGRSWNIATQERKICDMEIEMVTFVINDVVKLILPPDRQKQLEVRSRSAALSCLWSKVQWDTSGPGNSQTLGCLLTKHHQCTCIWNSMEMLFPSSWEQKLYKFFFMSREICRLRRGHNLFPLVNDYLLQNLFCKNHENVVYHKLKNLDDVIFRVLAFGFRKLTK